MSEHKYPGIQWYIDINAYYVQKNLDKIPELKSLIPTSLIKGFIRWAANQRLKYETNIQEEVEEYLQNSYAKNLSWINNKHKFNFYEKICLRDGEFCKRCNSTTDLTLDHIRPRSKGGMDKLNNLQILCRSCNSIKSNK